MASDLEEALVAQFSLPEMRLAPVEYGMYTREFRFCPNRKWSIDFYFPFKNLGVEVEGGTWVAGRHQRGSGFEKDAEKYLAALDHGITLIRVTGKMVRDGSAIRAIGRYLRGTSSASPVEKLCHALPKKERRTGGATKNASGASGRGRRRGKK